MFCYHEPKDENFLTAETSVASLQPKSLQMKQTLSKSYKRNLQPEFSTFHTLLIHWHVLMEDGADSWLKKPLVIQKRTVISYMA